ncbi:DUF1045 domain-containing protein [Segnochrobactraceae bacterium EtOH-i3]
MRHALYFVPAPETALARLGADWLGCPRGDTQPGPAPDVPSIAPARLEALTRAARRYGFHATLKAPFRLADGRTEAHLADALDAFSAATAPVIWQTPVIARRKDGFVLAPEPPRVPEIDALANRIVRVFDPFRAPPTPADLARRHAEALTPREEQLLARWGYPHVMSAFRFHMTLTAAVTDPMEQAALAAALDRHFAPVLGVPVRIDRIALCVEDQEPGPFRVAGIWSLTGKPVAAATPEAAKTFPPGDGRGRGKSAGLRI